MDDIKPRLVKCFAAVFPDLPEEEIAGATQDSITGWDSVATVTLVAVIQEEFGTPIDLEDLEHLSGFSQIHAYLAARQPV